MNYIKRISASKSPYIFFVRFLLLFLALYLFFPVYWGLTGVGGRFYSAFLAEHLNFIKAFSAFLTKGAVLLLHTFGYDTFQRQYNAVRIGTSRGVVVNPSCLGWGVMSVWVAFVYANDGTIKHHLKWMVYGIIAIIALNIIRIALIALANHLQWSTITSLDHHQTFNIASYCCIFILVYRYLTVQKKYERNFRDNKF